MVKNIWEDISESGYSFDCLADKCPQLAALKGISQNPLYHAEGDVYVHTKMVCENLIQCSEWSELSTLEQNLLFLAAAFHDIGKAVCTRLENGTWISPKHTYIGEKEFRSIVYKDTERFGLTFFQREMVAKLIRYHGLPVWFWTKERPEFELIKAAENIPLRLLYIIAKSDLLGRICNESDSLLENVELFADYAKEQHIWEASYNFADPYTKFCYFQRKDMWQGSQLYDDTEFDVILMSGLPLSGKDSWIEENGKDMPVISLDQIREEMNISPAKGSNKVAHIAIERARILLRKKAPFIWNATNIVQETRQKLVRLFSGYGARVHIVYLEVPYKELFVRNQKRERYIPIPVLEEMIRKLEIPQSWEAYKVSWITEIDK